MNFSFLKVKNSQLKNWNTIDNGYITLLLFPDQTEDNKSRPIYLYIHPLIIDSINYLGTFIIAIIIHKIREKKSGINEQDDNKKIKENDSKIKLIPNFIKQKLIKNISFLNFFIFNYLF